MPKIKFIEPSGKVTEVDAEVGDNVMRIAQDAGLDVEGTCEGCMACSTCHVIVADEYFDRLPAASEEEEDMLDLAYGVTDTSRLGCQIEITDGLDGLTVSLPGDTVDLLG